MSTKKPKFNPVIHVLKTIAVFIIMVIIFYGVPAFITLDLLWPLDVSNGARGVVAILFVFAVYMFLPSKEDYMSVNQRR